MYDLHTHSLLSDGVLIPSELVRRYVDAGYKGVVISDHVDAATLDTVVPQIVKFCKETKSLFGIDVVPGCEITHIPPRSIQSLTQRARALGAGMIIVHGETIVEPVVKGTNKAALESDIDVLAHPGLITENEVLIAKERGIALEITSRFGHSFTNGHVVQLAQKNGASLVYSSDFHEPNNLLTPSLVCSVLHGAGLSSKKVQAVLANTEKLFKSKCV